MTRIVISLLACGAFLVATGAATAGGPPLVKETVRVVDEPFYDPGTNCATGGPADIYGTFTGVLHVKVLGNGNVQFHAAGRGTSVLYDRNPDDTPGDLVPDGTAEFSSTANDVVLPHGGETHTFLLQGVFTTTAGQRYRFHVVFTLVLAADGTPRVDHVRFDCA